MDITWFLYAVAGMLFFAAWTLLLKSVLSHEDPFSTTRITVIGMAVILGLFWTYSGGKLPPGESIKLLCGSSILLAIGMVSDTLGVRYAPNPGFSGAIKSGQAVFIMLVSFFYTDGVSLSLWGFIFGLLCVIGVAAICISGNVKHTVDKGMFPWQVYGFIQLFSFAGVTILYREVMSREYMDMFTFATFLWVGAAIALLLWSLITSHKFEIRNKPSMLKKIIPFIGISAVAVLLDFEAARLAPNPGYASAIKGGQIAIVTILAPKFFLGTSPTKIQIVLVSLICLSVLGLAYFA